MIKPPLKQDAAEVAAVISAIWFAVVTAGRAIGWSRLEKQELDEIEAQADLVAERIDRRLSK